jgi:hypothetical protein
VRRERREREREIQREVWQFGDERCSFLLKTLLGFSTKF